MVILMIFATCYGVLQLAVLGSASRTVRIGSQPGSIRRTTNRMPSASTNS